jgi:hypothetical protein
VGLGLALREHTPRTDVFTSRRVFRKTGASYGFFSFFVLSMLFSSGL